MSKFKYHRGQEQKGRCVGKHCIHCWMLGRTKSLYGDKIKPTNTKVKFGEGK